MKVIVSTRPARADDEPFLRRLFAITEQERLSLESLSAEESKRLLRFEFGAHENHYATLPYEKTDTLLIVNDQPVGRLIVWQNPDEIRLADLALLPEVRNRGLGTALIQSLQAAAQSSGRPLRLVVGKQNRVLSLYRRMTFVKREETLTHLLLEWQPVAGGNLSTAIPGLISSVP
jgi:ribosomal protein S18 acetylase RimI-like enzyme